MRMEGWGCVQRSSTSGRGNSLRQATGHPTVGVHPHGGDEAGTTHQSETSATGGQVTSCVELVRIIPLSLSFPRFQIYSKEWCIFF